MGSKKTSMVVGVMMVAVVLMWTQVDAQSPLDMPCIQSLIPCASYLNSTNPPATCCEPLKKAFETQFKCLCAAFKNPTLLSVANINITQVVELPMHCGIKGADPSSCTKVAQGPTSAAMPPASKASAPGAASTPGTSGASSIGPVSSLVLLIVGFMFY